ncbi:MAG: 1-(5-phosphoribosyl)-5-((5-phosphoribosylamino)methylideneamino)imidazole-4-carboxamide isomerase [Betaproteobacteria bacterium]|nr:1-(5-phosphoribosyl)-5-((5-phosphoribosylamino)methylideneamino)imidazole-4-carboxamide isomerase [Betaproteobacteria bacterium]
MQVIPAIDILGGKCVRLREGEYDSARVFGDNPAEMARRFLELGARRLHVVDLDAAKDGESENAAAVGGILAAAGEFGAAVQIGGGLRTIAAIRRVLDAGASFAIAGTAAQREEFREAAMAEFPGRMIWAADARGGRLAVSGWREESGAEIGEFLDAAAKRPPAAVIFTDIRRDGMLGGANIEATRDVARRAPCPVYASGGVRGEEDVRALAAADKNIAGAVVGRAVYENMDILKPLLQKYGAESIANNSPGAGLEG